jgi:hypothetical protein
MLPAAVVSSNYEIGHPGWRFIISQRAMADQLLQWLSLKSRQANLRANPDLLH